MEVVKMIASVAGEEVFMGECHPARARVLVKAPRQHFPLHVRKRW